MSVFGFAKYFIIFVDFILAFLEEISFLYDINFFLNLKLTSKSKCYFLFVPTNPKSFALGSKFIIIFTKYNDFFIE
jgi:hypothetical protein